MLRFLTILFALFLATPAMAGLSIEEDNNLSDDRGPSNKSFAAYLSCNITQTVLLNIEYYKLGKSDSLDFGFTKVFQFKYTTINPALMLSHSIDNHDIDGFYFYNESYTKVSKTVNFNTESMFYKSVKDDSFNSYFELIPSMRINQRLTLEPKVRYTKKSKESYFTLQPTIRYNPTPDLGVETYIQIQSRKRNSVGFKFIWRIF